MKFFIDTADLDEIRSAAELGMLDGVTTNPSLIAKIVKDPSNFTRTDFFDHIAAICDLVDGPVSAEVTSLDTASMIKEGEALAAIHDNVVVKCPLTIDGLKAIRHLSEAGIATNATLVFSPSQAILAAKAGPPSSARLSGGLTTSVPTEWLLLRILSTSTTITAIWLR